MKRKRWCQSSFVMAWLFVSAVAARQNQTELGGYVKFFHHNFTDHSAGYSRTGVRLQMNISKTFESKGALFSSIDFNANDLLFIEKGFDRRGAELEIYPVELYGNLYFSNVDIRLGKQFIFWGKTDWINPTDNICAWDYANISSEIEDYRLPVTAAKINWYAGDLSTELVWVPVSTPHRISLAAGVLSERNDELGLPGVEMKNAIYPKANLRNSQAGIRLMHSIWGIDYSLSYYSGHDKNPSMISKFSPARQFIEIQPQYKRIQIIGGDFTRTFGRLGIKGEAAYFVTRDNDGQDVEIANPHFQYVIGGDYIFSDKLSLNLQWIQDIKDKFDADLERNVLMPMHPDRPSLSKINSSLSILLKAEPFGYVTSQLIGVYNTRDNDFFLLGFLNYEISDGINLAFGALVFNGIQASMFGKLDQEDKIFMEMKFSF